METLVVELMLIAILGVCIESYLIGKRKKIDWLKCIGKSGALASFVLAIVNIALLWVRRGTE